MRKALCIIFAVCFCLLSMRASVFAQNTDAREIMEVDIGIAPEDYEKLTTESEKIPFPVTVGVNGTYRSASINIRGSGSKYIGLASNVRRIPFEITVQKNGPFHNGISNHDLKFISSLTPYEMFAEMIALDLFAWMEVPVPSHQLAFVQFNGVDFGMYIAVEDINKTFLSKWYPGASPSVLKNTSDAEKPHKYFWSEWFGSVFEKVGSDDGTFGLLLDALDAGEGYERYINADEWLRFFACVAAIGGSDSLFTAKNNFALCCVNGRFDLIPWDQSAAFTCQAPNGIDRFYVSSDPHTPSRLFDLLMRNEEWKIKYRDYIRRITTGFLATDVLDARFSALLDAAAPYLPRDHSMLLNRETVIEDLWAEAPADMLNLRYTMHRICDNLEAQLDCRETVYCENEAYADFVVQYDNLASYMLQFETERIDHSLPQKIKDAYSAWTFSHFLQARKAALLIAVPAAALVLIIAAGSLQSAFKRKRHGV